MKKLALILAFAATTASAHTAHPCARIAEMAPIVKIACAELPNRQATFRLG